MSYMRDQHSGAPVVAGLFWGVETTSDYDHIVPLVGYEAGAKGVTAIYFNDLHTNVSLRAEVSSFVTTRKGVSLAATALLSLSFPRRPCPAPP